MNAEKREGEALDFLHALFHAPMGEDERAILCGFPGNPADREKASWRPWAWRPGRDLPFDDPRWNAYVCVSTVAHNKDGGFRRRKENFAAAHALMIDDVGTKVPRELVAALAPSAVIETSPGNEQHWHFFAEPVTDRARFERLVQGFIDKSLAGAPDPGMAGAMRVGRVPGFANDKPAYNGFRTRLVSLDAARRYTPEQVARAFGVVEKRKPLSKAAALELELRRMAGAEMGVPQEARAERMREFQTHLRCMRQARMVLSEPDMGDWIEVECPWRGDHTGGAGTGAAVRRPAEENFWYGGFKCWHGHCAGKGWRHLTDWLTDQAADILDDINKGGAA